MGLRSTRIRLAFKALRITQVLDCRALIKLFAKMKEGTRLADRKELRPLLDLLIECARWKPISQVDNEHAVKVRLMLPVARQSVSERACGSMIEAVRVWFAWRGSHHRSEESIDIPHAYAVAYFCPNLFGALLAGNHEDLLGRPPPDR